MNTPQTAGSKFNWHLPIRSKASSLLLLLTCILSATLLSGCSDSEENKIVPPPPLTKEELEKIDRDRALSHLPKTEDGRYIITDPTLLNRFKSWEIWNNVAYKLEEPLDNKEFWSKPRIMFAWYTDQIVNGKKMMKHMVLSVNLDGTDMRQVLPTELLIGDFEASLTHNPVRSPNNRYLIASMTGCTEDNRICKALFDLKNMTRENIAYGGSPPDFNWTPDSENIIFYLDSELKKYNLATKTLTDLPMVHSGGGTLYLRDNGKTFVASRQSRLEYSDLNGKIIKHIDFPSNNSELHQLSIDGKFFYYRDGIGEILDTEKRQVVYSYPSHDKSPEKMIFDPYTNEAIFWLNNIGVVKHDFWADNTKTIIDADIFTLYYSSIINYPPIFKNVDK